MLEKFELTIVRHIFFPRALISGGIVVFLLLSTNSSVNTAYPDFCQSPRDHSVVHWAGPVKSKHHHRHGKH